MAFRLEKKIFYHRKIVCENSCERKNIYASTTTESGEDLPIKMYVSPPERPRLLSALIDYYRFIILCFTVIILPCIWAFFV